MYTQYTYLFCGRISLFTDYFSPCFEFRDRKSQKCLNFIRLAGRNLFSRNRTLKNHHITNRAINIYT